MINRLVRHDSRNDPFCREEIRNLPVLELRRRMGCMHSVYRSFSPLDGGAKYRHRTRNYKVVACAD